MLEFLVGGLVVVTALVACYVVGSLMTLRDRHLPTFDRIVYGATGIGMVAILCWLAYEIGSLILRS